jgi:hypothetical protein
MPVRRIHYELDTLQLLVTKVITSKNCARQNIKGQTAPAN